MKNVTIKVLIALSLNSCAQNNKVTPINEIEVSNNKISTLQSEPHRYGGWHCPDNLNGFPAVNITDWKNVPVVNGRMPTKEDRQNGATLIMVDMEKYPNAKPLDITMPKLATIYNHSSRREELIIVIQAVNITNDSIVGFRYLNGGNGSARLKEINVLKENEIKKLSESRFISLSFNIKATQDEIWKILTNSDYLKNLQATFDKDNTLKTDWRKSSNVNYHYANAKTSSATYADKLFGNFYIQNDYTALNYTQKFFLSDNKETKMTELKIVCGPYVDDYDTQKSILNNWGEKVKELSEIL